MTRIARVAIAVLVAGGLYATSMYMRRTPDVRVDAENATLLVANAGGPSLGPFKYALAIDEGDAWTLILSTKPLSCRALLENYAITPDLVWVDWPKTWKEGAATAQLDTMRGPVCKTSSSMEPPPPPTSSISIESISDVLRGSLHVEQRGKIKGPDPCAPTIGDYHFTGDGHFTAPICDTPIQRIRRWFGGSS